MTLSILCSGSLFCTEFPIAEQWKPLLNNADALILEQGDYPRVKVELENGRRWIAFQDDINGKPYFCVGYQQTVGGYKAGNSVIGGSNFKVLAWLAPDGSIMIGDEPQ